MKNITITANEETATTPVADFKVEGSFIYVSGCDHIRTPFATDNGYIEINGKRHRTGDGNVFAEPMPLSETQGFDKVFRIKAR